ncbi:hypothetical protein INT44_008110 [Umbelopsis vinacea]|uniref:BTB domain-containing protein n=1 Tax=Umbelopsis vinacea TaxID=44442 RepID=A0A8H7PPK7_9FUNG|nr:hypothetical protein INT44_008110 [Umbelopsis vinacea]
MALSPRKRARTDPAHESVLTPLSKPYRASELIKALELGDERRNGQCRQQLAMSSDEELWTFLRRILRNLKIDPDQPNKPAMPAGKVLECLHFVVTSLSHRPQPDTAVSAALVPTASSDVHTLRICVRSSIQHLKAGSQMAQVFALKLLCAFLEDQKSATWKHPVPIKLIVDEIRPSNCLDLVLEALAQDTQNVQHYALRVLMALTSYFGKDMVEKDALWTVAARIGSLHDLLTREMRLPERQREKTWSGKLHICMLAGSLVRRLVQIAETSNATKLRQFGSSVAFSTILKVWPVVVWEGIQENSQIQGIDRLMTGLSSVVSKIATVSIEATDRIRSDPGFAECYHFVLLRYATIIQSTPQTLLSDPLPAKRPASPSQRGDSIVALQDTLHAISRIVVSVYDAKSTVRLSTTVIDQLLIDTLNFLVVMLWHPIVPEDFDFMSQKERIPDDAITTLEEAMKPSFGVYVQKKPNVIKTMLDILFRYLQLVYKPRMKELCIPAAMCLRHIAVVVAMEPCEAYESILSRAQQLAALLLYYPEGIKSLSENTSSSANAIFWHPIIEQAKSALRELIEYDIHVVVDVAARSKTIAKGKRALQSLLRAARVSEACPKIVEAGVLTIIDPFYPPRQPHYMDLKDGQLLCSLMAEILYQLAKDMALVRGKLRQVHQAIPCVLHILCQSIRKAQQHTTSKPGLERLQRSCLQVVTAFRFDRTGLQDWVRYPINEELMGYMDQFSEAAINNQSELSVTPILLKLLFPIAPDEQGIRYKMQPWKLSEVTTQSQPILLEALLALEPLSLLPTSLRQIMVYPKALRWLSQLLIAGKAAVLETEGEASSEEATTSIVQNNPIVSQMLEQVAETEQVACLSDIASDTEEQQQSNSSPEPSYQSSDRITTIWVQVLYQCLVRAISFKDSLQWFVIQDLYTDLFGPWLLSGNIRDEPMASLIAAFRSKARTETLQDLLRFFNYAKHNDEAIRLMEFTSVAICYAIPPAPLRTQILDLNEEDHLNASSVFGVLCRMLFYDLEPLDDVMDSANEQDQETFQRRTAAGQAVQILMLDMDPWQHELKDKIDQLSIIPIPPAAESTEVVFLSTEDMATPVQASKELLSSASETFRALLSDQYREATQETIMLRGVNGDDLTVLIDAIQRAQYPELTIVLSDMAWPTVVGLLLISDRYVVDSVTRACQRWMLERFADPTPPDDTLEGAMLTYRSCRDPTSILPDTSWPHSMLTHAALKTILTHMVRVTQTAEFNSMVEGIDEHVNEIDSFCSAMGLLLGR